MFIINPLRREAMDNMFSTHPDTANRIAALEGLAQQMGIGGMSAPAGMAAPGAAPVRRGHAGPPPGAPWAGGRSGRRRGPWG